MSKRHINHIVIHCTATTPNASVESIQNHWRRVLKWNDPGYHYLYDKNGEEHQLQDESKQTNGVYGHNHDTIHLSYIGGVDFQGKAKDTRTPQQVASMRERILDLRRRYPHADIVGHRDFSPDKNKNGIIDPWERIKECPCFDVREWLSTIYN